MKTDIYNQEGQKLEKQIEIPADIFGIKINQNLVHQVVVSQMSNRRQNPAKAKDRSEVSGGGKKPWRQKGTGRARHGSIRSPLWKGGGVTFGPTQEKDYKKKILKNARKKALLMVLSGKVSNNLLVVLDDLKLDGVKTKKMAELFNNLPVKNSSALLALPTMDNNLILSTRNIEKKETMQVKDLNCLDLLSYKYLIMPKAGIDTLKNILKKEDNIDKDNK